MAYIRDRASGEDIFLTDADAQSLFDDAQQAMLCLERAKDRLERLAKLEDISRIAGLWGVFGAWVSGSNLQLWRMCEAARGFRSSLGYMMLVTIGAASLAAGFAIAQIKESYFAGLLFGVGWFLVLMLLERLLLQLLDKRYADADGRDEDRLPGGKRIAAMRLSVALLGSYITSSAVLSWMFLHEIEIHLAEQQRGRIETVLAANDARIAAIDKLISGAQAAERAKESIEEARYDFAAWRTRAQGQIEIIENDIRILADRSAREALGKAGDDTSGLVGRGDAYRSTQSRLAQSKLDLAKAKSDFDAELRRRQAELDGVVAAHSGEANSLDATSALLLERRYTVVSANGDRLGEIKGQSPDGFLARISALHEVLWQHKLGYAFYALMFLIEISVFTLKSRWGTDEYHALMASRGRMFVAGIEAREEGQAGLVRDGARIAQVSVIAGDAASRVGPPKISTTPPFSPTRPRRF